MRNAVAVVFLQSRQLQSQLPVKHAGPIVYNSCRTKHVTGLWLSPLVCYHIMTTLHLTKPRQTSQKRVFVISVGLTKEYKKSDELRQVRVILF